MGIRAGGDPLTAVVPDLEQLAADPRNYLTEGPLLFGPRRFHGLTALFAIPGIVLLILWGFAPKETERLALGIALLLGAAFWLVYTLVGAGHSLFLGPDGVEIRYRDTTVYCPWDLFDVDGEPWTAAEHDPSAGLAMPIAPGAVGLVVWRRGMIELARGMAIRAPQAWFLSPGEMILPGRYELRSEDLGKLLLLLGTRLGGRVSTRALREVDRTAFGAPQADKQGFYTVSLTRFRPPPCCCVCAGAPQTTLVLTATSGFNPWVQRTPGAWLPSMERIAIEVPVCQRCLEAERAALLRSVRGWSVGLALAGLVSALFAPEEARMVAGIVGCLLGAMLGLLIGTIRGQPEPIQLRDYNPATRTIRIRFRNPEVEKRYRQSEEKRL
jgi:hypothetical protein